MTLSVTHTKVSGIADDPTASAAGEVLPSDWNATHTISGTIGVANGGTGTGTAFTAGSVVYAGASGVYSQDNAAFNWNDSALTLQIGSTSKASLVGSVTGAYDSTTHGSVRIGGSPGATSFFDLMSNPNGANSIPVPTFRPVVANKTIALDICPNGTPTDFGYGKAWLDLCNTDQITSGNAATQTIHMAAHASSFFLGGGEYNSSTILPFNFGTFNGDTAAETVTFTINPDASLTIPQPAKFSSMTSGSVPFFGASGLLSQDNAKFAWDDTGFSLNLKAGSTLAFGGSSSGTVTLKTAAAAGTWSMTLPTSAGTNAYVLQTDGSGVTSWVPAGTATMAIGSGVSGATAGSILFAAAGPVLAQDNANLSWDDTNHVLSIGGSVALYKVASASGDNWFEAGAGNITLTGFQNFGTGTSALASVTTGHQNTVIGDNCAAILTTGSLNVALGTLSLENITTGSNNMAIGASVMRSLTTGTDNIAIGINSMGAVTTGTSNIGIGAQAGRQVLTGTGNTAIGGNALGSVSGTLPDDFNTAIGFNALGNLGSGPYNTAVGINALGSVTAGTQNIAVGINAGGNSFSGGSFNTFVGTQAGRNFTSGDNNTIIGGWWGSATAVSGIIALSPAFSGGAGNVFLDYNYTESGIWSIGNGTTAQSLKVYNTTDNAAPPVNYERGIFDWLATSNLLTIGTKAGGTGTVRDFAIVKGSNTFFTSATTVVASLPTAGVVGRRHFVTDATATTFASIVAGGGANKVPCYDDGTNWRIG